MLLGACTAKKRAQDTDKPVSTESDPKHDTPPTGKPMTEDQFQEGARKALAAAGISSPERFRTAPGPGWMYDPAATKPFVFYTMLGDPGEPGDPEEHYVVAVDTRDAKGYYRDAKGFEAFLGALDYPKKGAVAAEDVLAAWQVIAEGADPSIANPDVVRDAKLKAKMQKPGTTTEPDGTRVTVGWTSSDRGTTFTRYTI